MDGTWTCGLGLNPISRDEFTREILADEGGSTSRDPVLRGVFWGARVMPFGVTLA